MNAYLRFFCFHKYFFKIPTNPFQNMIATWKFVGFVFIFILLMFPILFLVLWSSFISERTIFLYSICQLLKTVLKSSWPDQEWNDLVMIQVCICYFTYLSSKIQYIWYIVSKVFLNQSNKNVIVLVSQNFSTPLCICVYLMAFIWCGLSQLSMCLLVEFFGYWVLWQP